MFMLEDLKKRTSLAHDLNKIIEQNKYHSVVRNGVTFPASEKQPMNDDVFTKSDLAFVGANHGNIIGPLFALNLNEQGNLAILNEYLTYSDVEDGRKKKILEDELTALSVVISVFYPDISKVKLPKEIAEFTNSECEVRHIFDGSYLTIKKH